ncbi:MAG: hypothetical protein ABS903_17275, partial [Solibacillus sp.]
AKVNRAFHLPGATVEVSDELFEELERRGLVAEHEEIEDQNENKAPSYGNITEDKIREKLDDLKVDHSEAKDKKAAYALLEDALKAGE